MIIEFFGLPGAGKTTVAKELVRQIRKSGTVINRSDDLGDDRPALVRHLKRSRFALFGLIRRPRTFLLVLRDCSRPSDLSIVDITRTTWNLWCVLGWYLWLESVRSKPLLAVADQGLVQAAWSVETRSRGPLSNWPEIISIPSLDIYFVELSVVPSLARRRAQGRAPGGSKMRGPLDQSDPVQWDNAAAVFLAIKSRLGLQDSQRYFELKSGEETTAEANAARVLSIIL